MDKLEACVNSKVTERFPGIAALITSAVLLMSIETDAASNPLAAVGPGCRAAVTDSNLSRPNVATARHAVVFPLEHIDANILTSRTIIIKITLCPLKVDPRESLLIQAGLSDVKLPIAGMTVDIVPPNAAGSAFFKPLRVGETTEVYLSLADGWRSVTPPYAAIVAVVRSDGNEAPIESAIEILTVDLLP
ncbi:hypothetical protein NKH71_20265 [Mesorhizobium sp. M0983]|uniref:hypothetical protein n=1 Tax=unclassified Mesorhizobium TaxID=325217 RepID=UPI00333E07B5